VHEVWGGSSRIVSFRFQIPQQFAKTNVDGGSKEYNNELCSGFIKRYWSITRSLGYVENQRIVFLVKLAKDSLVEAY